MREVRTRCGIDSIVEVETVRLAACTECRILCSIPSLCHDRCGRILMQGAGIEIRLAQGGRPETCSRTPMQGAWIEVSTGSSRSRRPAVAPSCRARGLKLVSKSLRHSHADGRTLMKGAGIEIGFGPLRSAPSALRVQQKRGFGSHRPVPSSFFEGCRSETPGRGSRVLQNAVPGRVVGAKPSLLLHVTPTKRCARPASAASAQERRPWNPPRLPNQRRTRRDRCCERPSRTHARGRLY